MPLPTTFQPQLSRLQVLSVGIDVYEADDVVNLRGAVAAADALDALCLSKFHVPKEQIISLRNETATREAILHELRNLSSRTIQERPTREGDPFLIYFSGRTVKNANPEGWTWSKTRSEDRASFVPYDRGYPIPGRTIGALLHQLSQSKGMNITVIFDVCWVGGTQSDVIIPPTLDEKIWRKYPEDYMGPASLAVAATKSHILSSAFLDPGNTHGDHGEFTMALVKVLQEVEVNKTTYRELMVRIPSTEERTQRYDGPDSDSILFGGLVPIYIHRVDLQDGKLILHAGSDLGVIAGSLFSLYPYANFHPNDTAALKVFARVVQPAYTELSFTAISASHPATAEFPDLASTYYAVRTWFAQDSALRFHIPWSDTPSAVLTAFEEELANADCAVSVQADEDGADMTVRERDGRIQLTMCGVEHARRHGLELSHSLEPTAQSMRPFLLSSRHFFRYLRLSPRNPHSGEGIRTELHELRLEEQGLEEQGLSRHHEYVDFQTRAVYFPHGDNLIRDGVAEVVADGRTPYGLTIRSEAPKDLYIWAFYFDCTDLSITQYYQPHIRSLEPSLNAGDGVFALGHGLDDPICFYLSPEKNVDVGCIKIFVVTRKYEVNLLAVGRPSSLPLKPPVELAESDVWETVTIQVVQRKPGDTRSGRESE